MTINKILIAIALGFALASCSMPPPSTIPVDGNGNSVLTVGDTPKVQPVTVRVAGNQDIQFIQTVDPRGHEVTIMKYERVVCVSDTQYSSKKDWSCANNY